MSQVPATRRYTTPPDSVRVLTDRIRGVAGSDDLAVVNRLHLTLANIVVGQMLPAGVVKGGTAMKVRLGYDASRFSPDVDIARRDDLGIFLEAFTAALSTGWNGFTGTVRPGRAPRPAGVPTAYVMAPYFISLRYRGKDWRKVTFELGHNEIGDADKPTWTISPDIVALFEDLGLPAPKALPVMATEHQVAQKLHACSGPGSERAHDLVDLQLLDRSETLDLPRVRTTCVRLFTYRRAHSWPPTVTEGPDWQTLYADAAEGLDVVPDVAAAIEWVNNLIARIDVAKQSREATPAADTQPG